MELTQNPWHTINCLAINFKKFVANQDHLHKDKPFLIGISGDAALGKSTFAFLIEKNLPNSVTIEMDGYILGRDERIKKNIISGDDYRAVNFNQLEELIFNILNIGTNIEIQGYDHCTGTSYNKKRINCKIINTYIFDGSISIYKQIRKYLNLLIFFDSSTEIRKYLRMEVDIKERGYSHEYFKNHWATYDEIYKNNLLSELKDQDIVIRVNEKREFSGSIISKCYCDSNQQISLDEHKMVQNPDNAAGRFE